MERLGAIEFLGEPIKEYGFDLTDPEHNFCDGKNAGFEVIVNGSKDKGNIFFSIFCFHISHVKHILIAYTF